MERITTMQTFTIDFDSPNYLISSFNFNLGCSPTFHNLINTKIYINLSEGVFPPTNELVGIQNAYVL